MSQEDGVGEAYIRRAARGIDIISVCSAGRILHVIERCRFLDFRIRPRSLRCLAHGCVSFLRLLIVESDIVQIDAGHVDSMYPEQYVLCLKQTYVVLALLWSSSKNMLPSGVLLFVGK